MRREVQQESILGPFLFNLTFQLFWKRFLLEAERVGHGRHLDHWIYWTCRWPVHDCYWFSAAEVLLNKPMQALAKYDMQLVIDKTVWMYDGEDIGIEWLPVVNSGIQRVSSFTYPRSATEAVSPNIHWAKQQLIRLRPILKCPQLSVENQGLSRSLHN